MQANQHSLYFIQTKNNALIIIDNTNVCQSYTTNFLGIIIDETHTWSHHIHFIFIKMAKTIGILRCLSKYVSAKILLILYNILILPYLTYCCITFGYIYPSHAKKVFILQKKALTIIDSDQRNQHTDEE